MRSEERIEWFRHDTRSQTAHAHRSDSGGTAFYGGSLCGCAWRPNFSRPSGNVPRCVTCERIVEKEARR